MTTFTLDRCLLPLYDSRTEQGRVSSARPFGLTLSTQVHAEFRWLTWPTPTWAR